MSTSDIAFIDLMAQQERIRPQIDSAVARVFDHGRFIMGPEVSELERELADYTGAHEVVSCSSGTDAIWLPLLAHEVGPGDAVLLPSFTFTATAEAVALTGATPVFVDVDARTFNIDPNGLKPAVARAERAGLRAKVVIPVDLFGVPADYNAIAPVAQEAGLLVLADAAQSFGAKIGETMVGALGDVTGTSFFPAKPLGCYGDGGAIFTDSAEMAETLRSIRIHGRGTGGKYDNVRVGTNARLDTVQAAILQQKMTIFPEEVELRQQVADRYTRGLGDVVTTPFVPEGMRCAWAQYTIRHPQRDALAAAVKEHGVPTQIYYPRPLHLQAPYAHALVPDEGLPVTEELAQTVLSLPMYPYLPQAHREKIIDAIRACARDVAAGSVAKQA